MLQTGEERPVLGAEEVPFAPVAAAAEYPGSSVQELVFAWSQKWRAPLTLVFGLLIAGAAFFAYGAKQSDTASSDGTPTSQRDLSPAAALGDTDSDDDSTSADDDDADDDDSARSRSTTTRRTRATSGADGERDGSVRSTTTTPTSSTGDSGGSSTASSDPSITSTTTSDSTTEPSVTVPSSTAPTVQTTSSTSAPSTTSTTVANQPVFIGDRVSTGDWDGPGFPNLSVTLLNDANRDGVGEERVATASTNTNGNYGFNEDPGCYVVVFSVPNGINVLLGETAVPVCLESGQSSGRVDLVLGFPNVEPPASCNIQIGNSSYAGVEIWDPDQDFAPSYVFYGASGQVIVRTADLGPPDDVTNPSREYIEWTSQRFGYEESQVHSVSAVDSNGFESTAVTCERRNIG